MQRPDRSSPPLPLSPAADLHTFLCIVRVCFPSFSLHSVVNTSVQHLHLNSTSMENRGCMAFAETLVTNTSLQVLSLCHNNIGCEAATALADALLTNRTLVQLSVASSHIGDEVFPLFCPLRQLEMGVWLARCGRF